MSLAEKQFELEKQLHEQYAVNNNDATKNFVSFTVALLSLFGAFGYSFVHSSTDFSTKGVLISNSILSLDVFYIFSIIVIGMLFFLALLSLQLGYANRSNQIVIDRIRDRYFGRNKELIFGNGKTEVEVKTGSYNPTGKSWWSFVQDYFNLFFWLFFSSQILVLSFTIYKNHFSSRAIDYWAINLVRVVFTIQIVSVVLSLCFRCHYFRKYKKRFER